MINEESVKGGILCLVECKLVQQAIDAMHLWYLGILSVRTYHFPSLSPYKLTCISRVPIYLFCKASLSCQVKS